MVRLSDAEEAFLQFQRVGILALGSEDGYPKSMPLCFVYHQGCLYSGTGGSSWKVQRLQQDDRVSFLVHEYSEDWDRLRGMRLSGRGSVLRSGREYEEALAPLFAKYPQYGSTLAWGEGDVLLKVLPEKVASWHL